MNYDPLLPQSTPDFSNSTIEQLQIPLTYPNEDLLCSDEHVEYYEEVCPMKTKKRNDKKKAKKLRAQRDELLQTNKELSTACNEKEKIIQHLQSKLYQEHLARLQAESENTSRQIALIAAEAVRRGQESEFYQDLAFGGADAVLSRGSWLFQGGNLDRTVPHRKPRPKGYLLPEKDWQVLDETAYSEDNREGGEEDGHD